jgi:hypothetical protein
MIRIDAIIGSFITPHNAKPFPFQVTPPRLSALGLSLGHNLFL